MKRYWGAREGQDSKLVRLFGIDLRSLAAFRIALGILLLIDIANRSRFIETNYTDAGVHPSHLLGPLDRILSLSFVSGSFGFQCLIFAIAACAAAMLLVGVRTRLATAISWLFLISLHAHNPYVSDGGDSLLRALLFWSLFLPLGARFSIDARSGRGAWAPGPILFSAATVGLLLQPAFMYLSAGLSKSGPEWYQTHDAIRMVLEQTYWSRPLGQSLAQAPDLLRVLTPLVIAFEILGPILLFVPVATDRIRLVVMAGFIGLQLGFGLGIWLNLFPFISTAALLPFVPTGVWNRFDPSAAEHATDATETPPPPSSTPPTLYRAGQAALLLIVAYLGVGALTPAAPTEVSSVEIMGEKLGLIRHWRMYGRAPQFDFRFETIGRLANGTRMELLAFDAGPGWQQVKRIHSSYRFRYYLEQATAGGPGPRARPTAAYLDWLCRRWNAEATAEGMLLGATLYRIQWPILAEHPTTRVAMARRACQNP